MKVTKYLFPAAYALLIVSIAGCATLFADSEDNISFVSDPSGADIYLNGEHIGKTPVNKTVKRESTRKMIVVVKKKGYQTKEFHLQKSLEVAAVFNLTSGFSWTTDFATGNMIEYDPKKYLITLERAKKHSELDTEHWKNRKLLNYIATGFNKIKRDIALEQGEYLDSMINLVAVKQHSHNQITKSVIDNKQSLIDSRNPLELYNRILKISTT